MSRITMDDFDKALRSLVAVQSIARATGYAARESWLTIGEVAKLARKGAARRMTGWPNEAVV